MKITIFCRPDDASPKVLANSLKKILEKEIGVNININYDINFLTRLLPLFSKNKSEGSLHYRARKKLKYMVKDFKTLKVLKGMDAIIISECTPTGFIRNLYGIEELRKRIKRPILFHEVYYLENALKQYYYLKQTNNPGIERYDWHLAITDTTGIRSIPKPPWSVIGLNIKDLELAPQPKKEFFVLLDFRVGKYDSYRKTQIKVLKKLGIRYFEFKERMPMQEIRDYYKKAAVFFISFPEAFGLPIAECLAYGTTIYTPHKEWAMSWRLGMKLEDKDSDSYLPECFTEYSGEKDLEVKLKQLKESYHLEKTPLKIFDSFYENYPHFYEGQQDEAKKLISRIKANKFK